MDILTWLWESSWITIEGAIALGVLVLFAGVLLGLTLRARRHPFSVRSLTAVEVLRAAAARATETGEQMHVAVGTGGLGDFSTTETLAGLVPVSFLARRGALVEVPVRVRAAEPTALAGALAALQRGSEEAAYFEAFDPTQGEFVSPAPLAYGVGLATALRRERVGGSALIGRFGPEVLLPGEAGTERDLSQVGGTADPAVLPLFLAATHSPLIGEEIFALGPGLGRPEHTGSLVTQDIFRALAILGVLAATAMALARAL
ncbi:MAG: DUF6754 domain-containing protein [Anaerolineae bacterium]